MVGVSRFKFFLGIIGLMIASRDFARGVTVLPRKSSCFHGIANHPVALSVGFSHSTEAD